MSRWTHVAVVGIIGSATGLEPVSGGAEAPLLAPFRPGRFMGRGQGSHR